jgi:hypothetical protein
MASLEVLEALTVRFELTGDFAGVVIPLLGRSEADAESGVVLGVIEIYNLSENRLFSVNITFSRRKLKELILIQD